MIFEHEIENQVVMAITYLESGRAIRAEETLAKVLEHQPDHFRGQLLMVYAYRNQGRQAEGISLAKSLLGKGDDGQVFAILGDCYYSRMQIPEAIKYYEKALVRDPFNVDWMAQLVLLYYENEEDEKAREVMDRAVRQNPLHCGLWHNIFLFFHRVENNTVMENQALAKLADMEFPLSQRCLCQAMTAEKEGRYDDAYELYKKAFLVDPTDQNMKWTLTNFEEKRGYPRKS